MNTLKTLLWKEWKESRLNFIFAIAVLFILKTLQLYVASFHYDTNDALINSSEGLAFIAMLFCSVYGLITGIGMFAMEYTTRTLPYLMTRPVPKTAVLNSKWLIGIGEMIGLGLVAWVLTGRIDPREVIAIVLFPIKNQPLLFLVFCLYPILFYFLAVLSSLIFKDTTRSTVVSFILVILFVTLLAKISTLITVTPTSSIWLDISITFTLTLFLAISSTIIFLRQQTI